MAQIDRRRNAAIRPESEKKPTLRGSRECVATQDHVGGHIFLDPPASASAACCRSGQRSLPSLLLVASARP
jgi:hypothetical protein